MAKEIPQIKVAARKNLGTKDAARIRKTGNIPAVIYGHGQAPAHVTVNLKELTELLHKNVHLVEVNVDGKTEPCLVKEVQWNHLGSVIVHLDLARVDLKERVKVSVGIELVGEAIGLKEGGAILEHPIDTMEIECIVTQIPEKIKIDVSALKVGDSILVRDFKLPEGITTTLDPNSTLASISIVSEVVAAEPVEGAATEPEVIGKKAEEGEEGAAPAAGAAAPKKEAAKK